jgi:tether containing UBX domain for GLUT4
MGADEDEKDSIAGAINLISENKKRENFRDKTQIKLDQAKNMHTFTRSRVRVKFPDGFILEGNFGGKETVGAIYEFVGQNISDSDRSFILFETPPKRILTDKAKTLYTGKLIPSCLVYFAWTEGESLAASGPYINLAKLKDFITAY